MNKLAALLVMLPFLGCAHVNAVLKDMKECLSTNPALRDVEADIGPAITRILECDPNMSAETLPECAKAGLSGLAIALGIDGIRFIECVVGRIAGDEAAAKFTRTRAKAFMIYNAKPVKPILFTPNSGTEI